MSTTLMPIDVVRLALQRGRLPTRILARDSLDTAARTVESVGITVADLDRSVRFYTEVLSFVEVGRTVYDRAAQGNLTDLTAPNAQVVRLRLGEELIELTQYDRPTGRPAPPDTRGNDLWFQHVAIVVGDMARAYERLVSSGVRAISLAPQRLPDWNAAAGGIEAYYFFDPDGHPLELIHFPPDKGDGRWHRSADRLFLGIDHTSIVVRDTDTSLAYYRELLGMRVVGRSVNFGPEQESLSGVPGCRVRITTLAAESGMKVELLHYITPTDGRVLAVDDHANDLVHWETTVRVSDVDVTLDAVRQAGCRIISREVSDVRSRAGPARGFLSRDPDGHVMRFVETLVQQS